MDPFDGVTTFREALLAAAATDVILFDTAVFPPGSTVEIAVEASELSGYPSQVAIDFPELSHRLRYACPPETGDTGPIEIRYTDPNVPVDWNCNGTTTDIAVVDISGFGGVTPLGGAKDWDDPGTPSGPSLVFQCDLTHYADGAPPDDDALEPELTFEDALASGLLYPAINARVDLAPSCAANPVPTDGTGKVQLAIYGSSALQASAIKVGTLRLFGAHAIASLLTDEDGDGETDLIAEFAAGDIESGPPADVLGIDGVLQGGRRITGRDFPVWTATATDGDGDGVDDLCDQCPGVPGPPASPHGCPL